MSILQFPEGFLWGTAASAYQTEGGNFNNDWYRMEAADQTKPFEKRRFKEPCGQSCDHWNRYEQDYDLAQEMGIQVHRLSIEWSRVMPAEGQVDREALAHYRRMLQALRERGIRVMLCLHHFTIPAWVADQGGFLKPELCMRHFQTYLDAVIPALGDLVDTWLPINEPNVVPLGGYLVGSFPPYMKNPLAAMKVYREFFEMHLRCYQTIKKHFPQAPVGVAFAFMHAQPFDPESWLDRWFSDVANTVANYRFFDGIRTGKLLPPVGSGETMPGLKGAMDFVGLNYYSTNYARGLNLIPARGDDLVTDMGWVMHPHGIYECLKYLSSHVDLPIIVTENGVATTDESFRILYMGSHIRQVKRALDEGVRVNGYMCWSLTDNYEWDRGYSMRFGLIHVDYATQERRIKEGGRWFADVIRRNGLEEEA